MWIVIAIPEADFLKILNARIMIWEQCEMTWEQYEDLEQIHQIILLD